MLTIDRHFSKKRALVWGAALVYSAAMLWALVMEAMRSYMPRGIAYATPFQWTQVIGITGLLWLSLGYGAPLLSKGMLGLRRAQQLWEQHCCIDAARTWTERNEAAITLSGAMLVAAIFRLELAGVIPWYRQLSVCLTPIAVVSLVSLVGDLLTREHLPEKYSVVFQARVRFWRWIFLTSAAGIGYGFLRAFTEAP